MSLDPHYLELDRLPVTTFEDAPTSSSSEESDLEHSLLFSGWVRESEVDDMVHSGEDGCWLDVDELESVCSGVEEEEIALETIGLSDRKYTTDPSITVELIDDHSDYYSSSSATSTPTCSMPTTPFDMQVGLPSINGPDVESGIHSTKLSWQTSFSSNGNLSEKPG
ncbi:hypothetical protein HGRIS_005269 [Hohenbuehelia grisea]|uniref:Uncharacterized protein n=1 Tax=Hohenbuehelia grisea TaxID=104357 RepID=A0ABR3JF08_9AGAR